MTMTGDLLGTLRYMSPEQALAKRVVVDHRSDIYSLGVTLHELLTLEPVFTGDDRQELLRQIAFDEPRKPRQINSRIPQDLETIVLKAIEKNPADRYATAQELANDLRHFVENRSITARRPSLLSIVRKWVRRHRAAATVAAIAAVLLLILTAAIVADRWRQLREASRFVESSLQAARTALAADHVEQAALRLTEAQTRIDAVRLRDRALVNDVATLSREADRYAEFVALRDRVRSRRSGIPGLNALALYRVMDEEDWLAPLRAARLPEAHITRVSDAVYELLISVADDFSRVYNWPEDTEQPQFEQRTRQATEYLDKAASFHAPSRGYYWQRANCASNLNQAEKAQQLRQTALETPVHHTSELFYINRDRRWGAVSHERGFPKYSFEENYKDHREMLRRDPGYYNALFFTALVLGREERLDEALVGWYGCLAVQPEDYVSLGNRALTHHKLGHFDEALADAERALVLGPESSASAEVAAWILATCPVDEIRDGKRAIKLEAVSIDSSDISLKARMNWV
jgi:tetratricopeptide (TPR) repeat protein